jgi:hypothetical protein
MFRARSPLRDWVFPGRAQSATLRSRMGITTQWIAELRSAPARVRPSQHDVLPECPAVRFAATHTHADGSSHARLWAVTKR